MTITTEQKQAWVAASQLFSAASAQLPQIRTALEMISALASADDLGNKGRKVLEAMVADDATAFENATAEANLALFDLYQLIDQIPVMVAVLEQLQTAANAIKPGLSIQAPPTQNPNEESEE